MSRLVNALLVALNVGRDVVETVKRARVSAMAWRWRRMV